MSKQKTSFDPTIKATTDHDVLIPQSYTGTVRKKLKLRFILLPILAIALVGLVLFILAEPYKVSFYMDYYPRGNTYANLSRDGFAAESGGWLYLVGVSDYQGGLYKVNPDSRERVLLTQDNARSLNVKGDWVYYISDAPGKSSLYKVPVNGGEPTLLKEYCQKVILLGDWLYCESSDFTFFKLKTDGSGEKELAANIFSLIAVKRVYLYGMAEIKGQVCVVNVRPSGWSAPLWTNVRPVAFDGEFLYACEDIPGQTYTILHKENALTGEAETFHDCLCSLPFPAGDWLYVNCEDGIYRMNRDGTERTKVSGDHYTALNQAGEWLLFRSESTGQLMRMNLDGSGITPFWE